MLDDIGVHHEYWSVAVKKIFPQIIWHQFLNSHVVTAELAADNFMSATSESNMLSINESEGSPSCGTIS